MPNLNNLNTSTISIAITWTLQKIQMESMSSIAEQLQYVHVLVERLPNAKHSFQTGFLSKHTPHAGVEAVHQHKLLRKTRVGILGQREYLFMFYGGFMWPTVR
jgi:hypothetical protein